jgi:integrase
MAAALRNLHQKGGRYYARMVIPHKLRKILGKTELRKALGADRRSAIQNLPLALAGFSDTLAAARREACVVKIPPRPLNATEIAQLHYQEELDHDSKARLLGPGEGGSTVVSLNALTAAGRDRALRRVVSGAAGNDEIAAVVGWAIDLYRERGYVDVDPNTPEWRSLARVMAIVQLEALRRSIERDKGEFTGEPAFAPLKAPISEELLAEPVSLKALFDGYIAELRRAQRGAEAERRWKPCIQSLIAFLGHDDARRLNRGDVVKWKDQLLASLAPKTVRDSHLAALKAVLTWGLDAGKLTANVASGVKVRAAAPTRRRENGFTDEEAVAILRAASNYRSPERRNPRNSESSKLAAAKRWAPWLCAHTGARIAEITQLRKEDIRFDDSIAYIRITPDAGSVKTGQYRDVPIHPQLLELGFRDFVAGSADGALFYDASRKRSGSQHPAKQVAGRLSVWVRSLEVVSKDVNPNHGWRHRMKSVARELGLDPSIVDAIQGHAARTAGEAYGSVTLRAKANAIATFPLISI